MKIGVRPAACAVAVFAAADGARAESDELLTESNPQRLRVLLFHDAAGPAKIAWKTLR
jgi:hypothetical protein